jgi:hypothetical protein
MSKLGSGGQARIGAKVALKLSGLPFVCPYLIFYCKKRLLSTQTMNFGQNTWG